MRITVTMLAAIVVATTLHADEILAQSELTALSAFTDAIDAYIYGYPLTMIGLTGRVATTTSGTQPNAGRARMARW